MSGAVLGHFGHHFGYLGKLFDPILALLGSVLASFWFSWETFWPHFGSLGLSWAAFLAQDGTRWPKMAKKTSIFGFALRTWKTFWDRKSKKIHVKNNVFFRCVFDVDFYRFLIDFGLRNSRFSGSIFQGFLDLK